MTMPQPLIRPFKAEDKPHALQIWLDASAIAHPFFSNQQLLDQQALVRDVYLKVAETWVAIVDDNPVGFIGLLGNRVGGLFVAPSHKRQGIGQMLMEHALKLKGNLSLEVYESNHRAISFYKGMGFRIEGRRDVDDNGLPFPLLRMVSATDDHVQLR